MRRRDMLIGTGAAALALRPFSLGYVAAGKPNKRPLLLYFTRSVGYEHSVVRRDGDKLSHSEQILIELGRENGFDIECSKDGSLFDGDMDRFDGFVFYTCGDLSQPSKTKSPPMTDAGKKRLLDMVSAGTPFIGVHSSCFWGRGATLDPVLKVLGADFIAHGKQQEATMKVTSPEFPGCEELGESFRLFEEWYAMKGFAPDMHVILAQDPKGMEGKMYQRPPFPSTWARLHEKGRVFYTAMGHREDVWTNPLFQGVLVGGISWALGNVDADITPNIETATPKAGVLPQ